MCKKVSKKRSFRARFGQICCYFYINILDFLHADFARF